MTYHDKKKPTKNNGFLRNPNDRVVGIIVEGSENQCYVESCNIKTRNVSFKLKNHDLNNARSGDIVVLNIREYSRHLQHYHRV